MSYKYTTTSTDVYVGSADRTLTSKINGLMNSLSAYVFAGHEVKDISVTVSSNTDNVKAIEIGGGYYFYIRPSSASSTIATGDDAYVSVTNKKLNGDWSATELRLAYSNAFKILYNSANTGLRVTTHKFTDSSDGSRNLVVYDFLPISNGVLGSYSCRFGSFPTKDYFSGLTGTTVYLQSSSNEEFGKFHHIYNGSDTTHRIVFSGGDIYPPGNYAIASGVNLLEYINNATSTSMYRHVVDESVLYGIWMNGVRSWLDIGSSVTIAGAKFTALGTGYFIRMD